MAEIKKMGSCVDGALDFINFSYLKTEFHLLYYPSIAWWKNTSLNSQYNQLTCWLLGVNFQELKLQLTYF